MANEDVIGLIRQYIGFTPAGSTSVTLPLAVLERTIAELEKLRRLAGAVSDGENFEEIRKLAKAGEPLVDLQKK
jgi:hypothetical protein